MGFEADWDMLTSGEKELFQRVCRKLLKSTFIVKEKDDDSKKIYTFVAKNEEAVSSYFAYMGFDQEEISVLLALGFVVLFLILYKVFDQLRDDNFGIYTGMSAVLGAVALLAAAAVDHYKYVALSGVLLLGLVMLFMLFSASYRLFGDWGLRNRNLVIAGFLTYMILIFRIEKPVITSILLMALALCAVGVGFGIHQKPLRLYGLFLAVFVCAKLLLYDFSESGSGEKVVLFFVVGLLAIGISYLYMRLEKQEG